MQTPGTHASCHLAQSDLLCPELQGTCTDRGLNTHRLGSCQACQERSPGSRQLRRMHAKANDLGVVQPDPWGPTAAFFCFLPCTFFRRKNSSRSSSSSSPWHSPTCRLHLVQPLCAKQGQPPKTTQAVMHSGSFMPPSRRICQLPNSSNSAHLPISSSVAGVSPMSLPGTPLWACPGL